MLLLPLLLLLLLGVLSAVASSDAKAVQRIEELSSRLKSAPVIRLTDSLVAKYITERPRDYYAIIMLTAESHHHNCEAGIVLNNVAALIKEQVPLLPSSPPNKRLVVFLADFESCPKLFQTLRLTTVPHTYILPPLSAKDPKMKMADFKLKDIEMSSPSLFMKAIHTSTNISLSIAHDPLPFLAILSVLAVLLAYLMHSASLNYEAVLSWYKSPILWCFISLLCFSVGVSGSISCIIRAAPFYGQDRISAHIFATRGREQYLLEGIVVALWTIGCSFSFVLTFYSTKIPFPPLRHVGVILGLAMFAVFALQLWQAYTDKTPWYNIKDTLPTELWAMLSSGIKKNSGIFKRLMRLSEIYLSSSFKDFKSFRIKADTILVNYLRRVFEPYFSSFMKQKSP